MNAIPMTTPIVDLAQIVDKITHACMPVLKKHDAVGKAPPRDNLEYRADIEAALHPLGLLLTPAQTLPLHDMLKGCLEAYSGPSDDDAAFNSLEATLDHMRWHIGYHGDTKTEADTLARITILLRECDSGTLDENFVRWSLHEIWSDVRTIHQQLREQSKK